MKKDDSKQKENTIELTPLERLEKATRLSAKRDYYIENYKQDFFNYLRDEYNAIMEAFPGLVITPEARIKSASSYNGKIDKIFKDDGYKDIYDIFGVRYIVESYNGITREDILKDKIFELRDFLRNYNHKNHRHMPDRSKDYVNNPKKSQYQSLHETFVNTDIAKNTPDSNVIYPGYHVETQIRTYFMHKVAHEGVASHANMYKAGRIPGQTDLPNSLEYVLDDDGRCIKVQEKSREKAFYDFFDPDGKKGYKFEDYPEYAEKTRYIPKISRTKNENDVSVNSRPDNKELESVLGERVLSDAIQDKHKVRNIFTQLLSKISKKIVGEDR